MNIYEYSQFHPTTPYTTLSDNNIQISKMRLCYLRSRQNGMKKTKSGRILGTKRNQLLPLKKRGAGKGFGHKRNKILRKKRKREREKPRTLKSKLWTREEDELMMMLIKEGSARTWVKLALKIDGRNGKQCRYRYHNHLDPLINKRYVSSI